MNGKKMTPAERAARDAVKHFRKCNQCIGYVMMHAIMEGAVRLPEAGK